MTHDMHAELLAAMNFENKGHKSWQTTDKEVRAKYITEAEQTLANMKASWLTYPRYIWTLWRVDRWAAK